MDSGGMRSMRKKIHFIPLTQHQIEVLDNFKTQRFLINYLPMAPTIQPIVHFHSNTTKQSLTTLKRSPLKAKSRALGEWTPSRFLTSSCLSHLSEMRIWSTKPETWDESSETCYRQFGLLRSPHRERENAVTGWSTATSVALNSIYHRSKCKNQGSRSSHIEVATRTTIHAHTGTNSQQMPLSESRATDIINKFKTSIKIDCFIETFPGNNRQSKHLSVYH